MKNASVIQVNGQDYNCKDSYSRGQIEEIVDVIFDNNFDQSGYIVNGSDSSSSSFKRTSNYYKCEHWSKIYVIHENGTSSNFVLVFYNASKTFISNQGCSTTGNYNVPQNAAFYRCYKASADNSKTYISYIPAMFPLNFDADGYISNGSDATLAGYKRTSNYYGCNNVKQIIVKHTISSVSNFVLVFYNSSKVFISNQGASAGGVFNVPENAVYFRAYEAETSAVSYISGAETDTYVSYNILYVKDGALGNLLPVQLYSENQFDNIFDCEGYINNGADASSSSYKRTSSYYPCKNWERMYVVHEEGTASSFTLVFYDEYYNFIDNQGTSVGGTYIIPSRAAFFRVYCSSSNTSKSYVSDVPPNNPVDYSHEKKQVVERESSPVPRDEFLIVRNTIRNTKGKTIVNFGDSILGNFQEIGGEYVSVSALIQMMTGYNCVNAGLGGCQMTLHNIDGWKPFSMCRLADAIVSGDWSAQDASIENATELNLPYYFGSTIATLKSINFANVYMATIEYGTNDWSANRQLDNENDQEDLMTYAGALRYTIRKLLTAYPKLKIVVQNPTPRVKTDDPSDIKTSDTWENSIGKTLVDYIDAENSVCKQFKIPVIDAYYQSGFNIYDHDYYYNNAGDDVHLGINGRTRLAEIYASYLISHYRGY